MDKLIVQIFLWFFVDDNNRIKRAIDILFGNDPKDEVEVKPKPVNNKRDEIVDAINYLKNKKNKTKVDRDKIHMLEVILKSQKFNTI